MFQAQYHFIHMFMVEFIKCGFTSYDVNGFPNTFRLLCDPDPQLAGLSRLERQFQVSLNLYTFIIILLFY